MPRLKLKINLWFVLILGLFSLGQPFIDIYASDTMPPTARPALYEFGAGFCYACKSMSEVIAELQKTHGDQVEFRLVYLDREKTLFEKYRIMLIPTQVFLNAEGKEVHRHIGPLSREEIISKLKELKFIN